VSGRVLVTGGSMGIGRAIASELAAGSRQLAVVARGADAISEVVSSLPGEDHIGIPLDVTDAAGWERAVGELDSLSGLVCAAGVIEPIGRLGTYSASDFMRTIEVNLLGTWLAINACLPLLRSSGGSVVTFSGGGATSPLPRFDAYAASKAAVVRLTENLARDLADDGVRLNSVAPGFVVTRMQDAALAAGPEGAGSDYFEKTQRQVEEGGSPAERAAQLVAFLLSDEAHGITGKLISAPWDPWEDEDFRQRLRDEPDLATLRRIDDQFFTTSEPPRTG
jgi:NAD(P)-dependent dehydrogenase (short-subunit alcohol dehydrogenase family)